MKFDTRSLRRAAFTAIGLLGAASSFGAPAAIAAPTSAGEVVVTSPASTGRVAKGGSATPFTMRLPKGSTCQEDSADGGYRVQSFLVPVGTEPGTVRYKSQGPDVPDGWAVYKTTTDAYIQEQTAKADVKGGPGPILDLPALSFAVFTGGELKPGRYHMGVACSYLNETMKFWSTEIAISTDPTDQPARLRWVLPGVNASGGGGTPTWALAVAGVVVVGGVANVVASRRRRSSAGGHA